MQPRARALYQRRQARGCLTKAGNPVHQPQSVHLQKEISAPFPSGGEGLDQVRALRTSQVLIIKMPLMAVKLQKEFIIM